MSTPFNLPEDVRLRLKDRRNLLILPSDLEVWGVDGNVIRVFEAVFPQGLDIKHWSLVKQQKTMSAFVSQGKEGFETYLELVFCGIIPNLIPDNLSNRLFKANPWTVELLRKYLPHHLKYWWDSAGEKEGQTLG